MKNLLKLKKLKVLNSYQQKAIKGGNPFNDCTSGGGSVNCGLSEGTGIFGKDEWICNCSCPNHDGNGNGTSYEISRELVFR